MLIRIDDSFLCFPVSHTRIIFFFFGEPQIVELLKQTGFELVRVYRYNIVPQLQLFPLMKLVKGSFRGDAGGHQSGSPVTFFIELVEETAERFYLWVNVLHLYVVQHCLD